MAPASAHESPPAAQRRLQVGFLIDRWDPSRGGAERALVHLALHLESRGHRVLAFACEGSAGAPGELVRVAPRGLLRGTRERALARDLPAAAHEAGCDVTVGVRHLERVDLYWPHGGAHAASLAARRRSRGLPERPPRGRHRVFIELERELCERGGARAIACPSRLVFEELSRIWPASIPRLELVPNGVDLERFHPRNRAAAGAALRRELRIEPKTPLIGFSAREPRLKGLPQLLDALAKLTDRAWHLLVAGPKRPRIWTGAARARGLGRERVSVRPEVDPVAMWSAADLCALPTWRDTSSLVVLEALASGTPAVTTRFAGAADSISHDVAGTVIAAPDDASALECALADWLARIDRGALDRDHVRACVSDRSAEGWLTRLTERLERLAESSTLAAERA
jgi:UDP-glucose:(heptosyl)LPS alpha-1,3-glucosyltransferase